MRWKSTSPYTHTAIPIDKSSTSLTNFLLTNRQRRMKILPDFWATVCITVHSILSDRCLSCLSVCNVGVLWPNGWMDQDATWYGGKPLPRPHCVRRGPNYPMERGTAAPTFRPMSMLAKRSPISATYELLYYFIAGLRSQHRAMISFFETSVCCNNIPYSSG